MNKNKTVDDQPSKPLEKNFSQVIYPFQVFIEKQTTGSMVLIACVAVSLLIANSPLQQSYQHILHLPLGLFLGDVSLSMSLLHWVNEGLMTGFFFIIGLEIKREVLVGEINKLRLLIPVAAAALGGMVVPAVIYSVFNVDTVYALGWGIPMATDTAFAIGILALLGNRVPKSAFTFLTALAIIDDLGAVAVIGVFYSDSINGYFLMISAALILALGLCNQLGIRRPLVYFAGGVVVWLAMLGSGLHATIAGILVALTVPAHPEKSQSWFSLRSRELLKRFHGIEKQRSDQQSILAESDQHIVVEHLKEAAEKSTTPLRRWENALEYPVTFFILPVFALINAGIAIDIEEFSSLWTNSMAIGIVGGLVIGKGLGIPLFVWAVLRFNWGELPEGLQLQHVVGIGLLGGMGFTMSIFIANLAFGESSELLVTAKIAILIASFLAGLSGYVWLRFNAKVS